MRRLADQLIAAQLKGFQAQRVRLFAKYASSSKWEQADMRPETGGARLRVSDRRRARVAGLLRGSRRRPLQTVSLERGRLPGIKKMKVTYHFPAWTGMKDRSRRSRRRSARRRRHPCRGGHPDRPAAGQRRAALRRRHQDRYCAPATNGSVIASVPIQKDGMYHVAAVERAKTCA